MMTLSIRPFMDTDLLSLLPLADAAVPFDLDGNRCWVQARQTFDETTAIRRHYIVEADKRTIVGYGAIEQQDVDSRRFRIYLVPERFGTGIEDLLFAQLLQDLHDLDAHVVWMREHHTDTTLVAFFRRCGFVETHMVWDMRFDILASTESSHSHEARPTHGQQIDLTTLQHERQTRPDVLTRLFVLYNALVLRDQLPPFTESGFTRWLAQPTLISDAFVIVTYQDAYIGLHVLKRIEHLQELVQEFAGLADPSLMTASSRALHDWLSTYLQQGRYQRINAYVPAQDSSLLALNEAIGYQRIFGYLAMEKRLGA
jgi:hypothetical protein